MAKPAPSRPEQFRRLLREASAELGLPRSHDKPQRLATVRLQRRALRELQQFDLLSGKLSDPSRLLDADDKLRVEEERLQAPSASGHDHQLTIEFVHPAQVTCPGCGLAYDPVAAQAEKDRNAKRQRELQTQATAEQAHQH